MRVPARLLTVLLFALGTLSLPACQQLNQIANLRDVDFAIDGVNQANLAGIDLDQIRSRNDLGPRQALLLTRALSRGELPLRFNLLLAAENPEANGVTARMVNMDWTLFLEDRETISGTINEEFVLPPGQTRGIPIGIELDLLRFFDDNAQDLFELATTLAGGNGAATNIRLEATPTISTPIGPIRYPRPITIVSRDVGSSL